MRKKGHIPSLSIIIIPSKIYKVCLKICMNAMKLVSKKYLQIAFFFSVHVAQEYLYSILLIFLSHTCSAMRKKGHIPSLSIINIPSKIYKVCLKIYMNAMKRVSKKYLQIAFFFSVLVAQEYLYSVLLSFLRHTCSAMRKKGNIPALSIIIASKIYKVYLKNYMNAMILVSKEYLQIAFIFSILVAQKCLDFWVFLDTLVLQRGRKDKALLSVSSTFNQRFTRYI